MINKTYRGRLDIQQNGDFIIYQEDNSVVNITQMLSQFYLAGSLVYIKISRRCFIEFEEDGKIFKKLDEDGIISNFICGNNLDYCLWYLTDDIIEVEIKERCKDRDF